MGGKVGNCTGGVGCFVGVGVGTGNGIELGNENAKVEELKCGNRIFVGIGDGAMDGVWIGEGAEVDKGIKVSGGDGIKCIIGLGDVIII